MEKQLEGAAEGRGQLLRVAHRRDERAAPCLPASLVPAPVVALLSKLFGRTYTKEIAPVWKS